MAFPSPWADLNTDPRPSPKIPKMPKIREAVFSASSNSPVTSRVSSLRSVSHPVLLDNAHRPNASITGSAATIRSSRPSTRLRTVSPKRPRRVSLILQISWVLPKFSAEKNNSKKSLESLPKIPPVLSKRGSS